MHTNIKFVLLQKAIFRIYRLAAEAFPTIDEDASSEALERQGARLSIRSAL
jgi:hypothetical protein